MTNRKFFFLVLGLFLISKPGWAASAQEPNERRDRLVDAAAASAQEQAIGKLRELLKKHRNSPEEAVFLERLADTYFQAASLYFRIAHGSQGKKTGAQKSYQNSLQNSVDQYDRLIARFPSYPMIHKAYFQRAKAWEELGNKTLARRDFLHVLNHYPESDESFGAAMALADQSIEANQHEQALKYLGHVEKTPDHPLYPFALYKSAWSMYNLKRMSGAVGYLEKHIFFLQDKMRIQAVLSSSDESFLQNSLQDLVMFDLSRFEGSAEKYPVDDIFQYFKKMSKGKYLSNMALRAAKLIRAHGRDSELMKWRDIVLSEGLGESETLEIHLVVLEHLWNRRQHAEILQAAQIWERWTKEHPAVEKESVYKKSMVFLGELAKNYQELTLKNKNHEQSRQFAQVMRTVYGVIEDSLPENDPQTAITHYNIAETYFAIKDYVAATQNYRWIVGRFKKHPSLNISEIKLRAIASRYEDLKQKKIIPQNLSASKKPEGDVASVAPELEEWIGWIDDASGKEDKIRTFLFESNRALYAQGQVQRAVERMTDFSEEYPASEEAVAASSLVLDTFIASSDWEKVHESARDYLDIRGWKNQEHLKKLKKMAAQAWLKLIESDYQATRFSDALGREGKLRKWYKDSEFYSDSLLWLAKSSMSLQKTEHAKLIYDELVQQKLGSEQKQYVLAGRAALFEGNRLYLDAAQDYWQHHILTGQMESYKKALEYFWIEGQLKLIGNLQNAQKCKDKDKEFCELFASLYSLNNSVPAEFKPELPGLAAYVAVKKGDSKTLWDQLSQLRKLAKGWDELPPQIQYALLPSLIEVSQKGFERARRQIHDFEKLRASPKYLQNRVENVLRLEKLVQAWSELPWMKVRMPALDQLAGAYEDFSSEIKQLKASDEDMVELNKMADSLDQKSAQMRTQVDQIESADLALDSSITIIQNEWLSRQKDESLAQTYLKSLQEKKMAKAAFLLNQLSGESKEWAELLLWWNAGAQYEARDRVLKVVAQIKGKPVAATQ